MSTKWLLRLCISFVLVFVGIYINTSAMAQSCAGVTILNESNFDLNESAICEASMPWVNKNQGEEKHGVYIFVTDAQIDNETDWMAIRDRVEIGWGIYTNTQTITNNFVITAVVVALTTDTNQPEGQDFGFGESLQDTGLVLAQPRIEAEMKQAVERGDVNGAITRALQNAYSFAYPAIIQATATSVPATPRPTQIPTVSPTQMPTRVIEVSENSNVEENSNPWSILLLPVLLIIIVLGGFGIIKYVLPYIQSRQKYNKQVLDLKARIPRLLNKLDEMFMDDALSTRWSANGGKKYPEQTALVTEYIRRIKAAHQEAGRLWGDVRKRQPRTSQEQQELVKIFETIYFSVVGEQPTITDMDEDEQLRLLDTGLDLKEEVEDVQLVEQLQAVESKIGEHSLMINHLAVNLDNLDDYGILGYIQLIKLMLMRLKKSVEVGPQLFEKATALRKKLATEIQLPPEMSGVDVFEKIDFQIDKALTAQSAEEWLTVQDASENALQRLEKLSKLMKDFSEVLVHYRENQQKWQSLRNQGYNQITDSNEAMQETTEDFAKIIHAIVAGDDALYAEFANELFEDSRRAITLMKEQVALRLKNEDNLIDLAEGVARLHTILTTSSTDNLKALQEFPQSNWNDVASNFEQAERILQSLQDNPADSEDTASKIARLNSFEVQQFENAEAELVTAFAQLNEAERLLMRISQKQSEVKQLESDVKMALSAADQEVMDARNRRNAHPNMVDESVDKIIADAENVLRDAKSLVNAREYTKASELIQNVRVSAHQAVSSADEQIEQIEHLFAGLDNLRRDIEGAHNQMTIDYNALELAARTDSTEALYEQANNAFRKANQSEQAFISQDKELIDDIQQSIHLYQQVAQSILTATSQIQQDSDQYQQSVNDVIQAIDEAEAAISRATDSVNNPNANGVGQHALQMARSLVPSYPPPGETYDALERRNDQALEAENRADEAKDLADDEVRRVRDQQAATAALTTAVITSVIQHSREHRREESHPKPSQSRPQVKPSIPTPPIMGNSNTRSAPKPPAGPKMGNSKTR